MSIWCWDGTFSEAPIPPQKYLRGRGSPALPNHYTPGCNVVYAGLRLFEFYLLKSWRCIYGPDLTVEPGLGRSEHRWKTGECCTKTPDDQSSQHRKVTCNDALKPTWQRCTPASLAAIELITLLDFKTRMPLSNAHTAFGCWPRQFL